MSSVSSSAAVVLLQPATTYFCYLLHSQACAHSSATYIGFTVHPLRRLRQHNGVISAGAWRTSRRRPWSMPLCVYGFTSKISALQFEWHWTNPHKSTKLKAVDAAQRRYGPNGKLQLLYTMISMTPWSHMPLHLRYTSQQAYDSLHVATMKAKRVADPAFELPTHIDVTYGDLSELDIYKWKATRKRGRAGLQQLKDEARYAYATPTGLPAPSVSPSPLSQRDGDDESDSGCSGSDDDASSASDEWDDEATTTDGENAQTSQTAYHCALCANLRSMPTLVATFFTGCTRCSFIAHLACMTESIFNQTDPHDRTHANVSTEYDDDPMSSPLFAGTSPSAPLIPPPGTGSCPQCQSALTYPQLIDRCRHMHTINGQRGGDVFYAAAQALLDLIPSAPSPSPSEEASAEEKVKMKQKWTRKAANSRKPTAPSRSRSQTDTETANEADDSSDDGSSAVRKRARKAKRQVAVDANDVAPSAVRHRTKTIRRRTDDKRVRRADSNQPLTQAAIALGDKRALSDSAPAKPPLHHSTNSKAPRSLQIKPPQRPPTHIGSNQSAEVVSLLIDDADDDEDDGVTFIAYSQSRPASQPSPPIQMQHAHLAKHTTVAPAVTSNDENDEDLAFAMQLSLNDRLMQHTADNAELSNALRAISKT